VHNIYEWLAYVYDKFFWNAKLLKLTCQVLDKIIFRYKTTFAFADRCRYNNYALTINFSSYSSSCRRGVLMYRRLHVYCSAPRTMQISDYVVSHVKLSSPVLVYYSTWFIRWMSSIFSYYYASSTRAEPTNKKFRCKRFPCIFRKAAGILCRSWSEKTHIRISVFLSLLVTSIKDPINSNVPRRSVHYIIILYTTYNII